MVQAVDKNELYANAFSENDYKKAAGGNKPKKKKGKKGKQEARTTYQEPAVKEVVNGQGSSIPPTQINPDITVKDLEREVASSAPVAPATPQNETLSDFLKEEAYKQTDEYKEKVAAESNLKEELKDGEVVNDLLSKVTLSSEDLAHIVIEDSDRTVISKENLTYLVNSTPTYQIVANQSAYIAHMKSLRFKDVFSLANSTGDNYHEQLRRYNMYFNCMEDNSLGVGNFDTWTKITSIYDIPTFEFGIFCQTFPGDTDFDIRCAHCGHTMKQVKIGNDQLIAAKNEEVYEQLGRVIESVDSLEKSAKYSVVNKVDRIQLPVSKAIVDIHIPTVADKLKFLQSLGERSVEEIKEYVDIMLFIKDAMILNLEEFKRTGAVKFVKLKDYNEVLLFLQNMHLDDIAKLNSVVEEMYDKYVIDYKIKSFPCFNCKKETGDIDIEIGDLLFGQALERLT